jgi:hypothetical protein
VACSWDLAYLDTGDAGESSDATVLDGPTTDAMVDADASTEGGGADTDVDAGPYLGDGGNLIQNPSCENGTRYWSTLSGTPIAPSTTYVRPGEQDSCRSYDRVNPRGCNQPGSYDGPLQDISAVVVPGHTYTVSVWVLWAPPPSDGGSVDAGAEAGAEAGASDAGTTYPPQGADITMKQTCGTSVAYVPLGSVSNTPEAEWTLLSSNVGALSGPTGCSTYVLQLYIEGPDPGLDLYTADATLLLYQ